MAEHCDNFYYLNDIINIRMEKMNQVLTAHLMDLLIQPIYADSLVKKKFLPSKQRVRIDSVIALALLCHVLHIFRHTPLVTSMVVMLFSNSTSMMDYSSSPPTRFEYSNSWFRRNLYREAIMGFLKPEKSKNQYYYDLNTLPALCLLYMSCRNNAITPDVLIATDVYPQKLFKKRRLMDSLTSDYSDDDSFSFYTSSSMASTATSIYGRRESGGSLSIPIPTIKISSENNVNNYGSQHTRNYRGELVQMILTLLCEYYPYCRTITLQMATEVLLELLHYNGSEDCLTTEQIEMMIKTEKILQDRIKKYKEFPLETFSGDKYVKLIKCVKALYLIRKSRTLLSRKTPDSPGSSDSSNSSNSLDIPDIIPDVDTDIGQELSYQKCNDNDPKLRKPMKSMKSMFEEVKKFERQQQQMQNKKNINIQTPDDEINNIEKRKKVVLDALGMQ
ncbi:7582_t:CDS:2 [Diversispora eburnea]|uniref:7582_t:CDS:1 n=1 Tax=Diversispora eburnea TaxID=1213867 RepID=A0A9N8ZH77_9GLOM|nr:7582_t:CDS:2 [Diversispora eburnea]